MGGGEEGEEERRTGRGRRRGREEKGEGKEGKGGEGKKRERSLKTNTCNLQPVHYLTKSLRLISSVSDILWPFYLLCISPTLILSVNNYLGDPPRGSLLVASPEHRFSSLAIAPFSYTHPGASSDESQALSLVLDTPQVPDSWLMLVIGYLTPPQFIQCLRVHYSCLDFPGQ